MIMLNLQIKEQDSKYLNFPDIKLNLKYELSNTTVGVITATPIVRGEITDVLLYEEELDMVLIF